MATGASLGAGCMADILRRFPPVCFPQSRRFSLHRLSEPGGARRRASAVWLVRPDVGIVGRDSVAMARAVPAGRLFLHAAADRVVRVLRVFLLRELALYRHLHG